MGTLLLGLGLGAGASPSPGLIWAGYGDVHLERGETETALVLYRRALAADPDLEAAVAGEGAALALLGRREEALARLDAYLERYPESPLALHVRGQVRLMGGWITGAYRDLRRAHVLAPGVALYALAYARAAVLVGAWDEAREVLRGLLGEETPEEVRGRAVSLLYLLAYLEGQLRKGNARG